jgi:hypothetical protein
VNVIIIIIINIINNNSDTNSNNGISSSSNSSNNNNNNNNYSFPEWTKWRVSLLTKFLLSCLLAVSHPKFLRAICEVIKLKFNVIN